MRKVSLVIAKLTFLIYKNQDKDIIENEILPHVSTAKRRFETKSHLTEVVNSILYKLKTGIQ